MGQIILDMDTSASETYGHQEGSAYNGHFTCECCDQLFRFNQFGDLERTLLREGNVSSADDWHGGVDRFCAETWKALVPETEGAQLSRLTARKGGSYGGRHHSCLRRVV